MNAAARIQRGTWVARFHTSVRNTYQVGRTSSVNTAIARGIRKSDGFGTSGRRKPPFNGSRDEIDQDRFSKSALNHSRDYDRFRKPSFDRRNDEKASISSRFRDDGSGEKRTWGDSSTRTDRGGRNGRRDFGRGSDERRDMREQGSVRSGRPTTFGSERSLRLSNDDRSEPRWTKDVTRDSGRSTKDVRSPQAKSDDTEDVNLTHNNRPEKRWTKDYSRTPRDDWSAPNSVKLSQDVKVPYSDRNIPLSIPYTTPASEFLYGTSVVEAALSSSRQNKRKLYKLYVLSTPAREDPEKDRKIINLARRARVTVQNVPSEGVRLLDKMSAGRPHNGYILEASPLPRLPVKSLGAVNQFGFELELDHQSREEAEVNGNEKFISTQSASSQSLKRNPLVLYLDSVTDPGNLGGIIRTASFLGINAIAISTRNSAPFSPVVLKASAGASENITIFSVSKPSGFIADSKTAGWRVYAAVAPEKGVERESVAADKLEDPLSKDPCVLMLGSEGEGLRWNLRSKADVDVYIRGDRGRGGVDSLNVSVAAGILCNAFVRVPRKTKIRVEKALRNNDDAIADDVDDTEAKTLGDMESEDGTSGSGEAVESVVGSEQPKANSIF